MNRIRDAMSGRLQPDGDDRIDPQQLRELFRKLAGCNPEDYPTDPEERRRYHEDRQRRWMAGEDLG